MLKICEWPLPGQAQVCQPCKVAKLKCTVGGVPQSTKRAKLTPPNKVGLSKDTLFLESKSGEEVASEESEALLAGLLELEGVIRVQTAALQNQLMTQEWLAGKMERMAITLDRHCAVVEELLVALTSAGQGFRAGLDAGLDTWARMGPHEEWGGIRAVWEEASEDEYEYSSNNNFKDSY